MTAQIPNYQIPDTAVSVAGLTAYIQALLEENDLLRSIWVIGEVSSTRDHSSGLFFTLQDKNASIRCAIWKNQQEQLVQLPVLGEQLLVLGSVRLYAKRGEYQLTVLQALPAGEGLQALRYRQLRSRLEAEGLFDLERKRPLPFYPQIIAVVTSAQAAAWGDIQRTLKQRYPGLHVLLSPAIVQGNQAADSIVAAIERVQRDGRAEVLILARGGGATEDLVCFNDERVVRAIANCSIPVMTGIGHQRDESLADLVADFCAHTPTAAALQVVPELATVYTQHRDRLATLQEAVLYRMQIESDRLQQLRSRLRRIPQTSRTLQQATQKTEILRQKLAALDPYAVLKRGYALVKQSDGAIARSTADFTSEQELLIQLSDGQVQVKVIKILTPSSTLSS